jgi:hypothetical protein
MVIDYELILRGYLQAAIWTSEDDLPPVSYFSIYDFDPIEKQKAIDDIKSFVERVGIIHVTDAINENSNETFGHNFWLTRNHHGSGFWDDDDYSEGKYLTEVAHKFKEVSLYVNGDGLLAFE